MSWAAPVAQRPRSPRPRPWASPRVRWGGHGWALPPLMLRRDVCLSATDCLAGAYLLGVMPPELIKLLGIRLPLLRRDPHYFLPTIGARSGGGGTCGQVRL